MRIAVAMSGGIDSSITAILLKEMGHEIIGITAKMIDTSSKDSSYIAQNEKIVEQSVHDAKLIAKTYNFEHHVVDLEADFDRLIVNPFCREYLEGKTPSPCIRCNAAIKFKKFIEIADSLGCEKMATGHYAEIENNGSRYYIKQADDLKKDQSYFLFMLEQDVLKKIVFPLGKYTKEKIRELAKEYKLPIAAKPDSQEICFIHDDNYKAFIEEYTNQKPAPGKIVDKNGNVLGQHKGIYYYTVGQRRGLGIAAEKPLYVLEINAADNCIIVGFQEELEKKGLIATELSFMKETNLTTEHAMVKTRSTQKAVPARITQLEDEIKIDFTDKIIGISPGQAAVIYSEDKEIIGGGWIKESY
jgi:tRNA-specific 2-thiouridylase